MDSAARFNVLRRNRAGYSSNSPQFMHLPMEIRLMIWEFTWPPPRLVLSHFTSRDPPVHKLHVLQMGKRAAYIKDDGSQSVFFGDYTDHGIHPVALQVCQESRHHTLRAYTQLRGTLRPPQSYISLQRDALRLPPGAFFQDGYMEAGGERLRKHIAEFRHVYLPAKEWIETTALRRKIRCAGYSEYFPCLRTLYIALVADPEKGDNGRAEEVRRLRQMDGGLLGKQKWKVEFLSLQ